MRPNVLELLDLATAPRRPPCFRDERDWRSWLESEHAVGGAVVRRVDCGKSYRTRATHHEWLPIDAIDYCADCTAGQWDRMLAAGRCRPSAVSLNRHGAAWPPRAVLLAPIPEDRLMPINATVPAFAYTGDALMRRFNVRRPGQGESRNRGLTAYLQLEVMTGAAAMDQFDGALRRVLWTTSGHVRNPLLRPLRFDTVLADCTGRVGGVECPSVQLSDFEAAAVDGSLLRLTFSAVVETTATDLGPLADALQTHVPVVLRQREGLFGTDDD